MPFYLLSPEVAGGWGPNIQARRDTHPPIVTHMHYEFEGWSGDDLLTTFPEFVVTDRLAAALESSTLTGFRLGSVEVSAGGMWEQMYADRPLPPCRWLQVSGKACQADLGKTALADLVVSAPALELLRSFTLSACTVQPWALSG